MDTPPCQPTVCEPSDAQYGLFYWIFLTDNAKNENNIVDVISKSCSQIHHTAQRVNDPTGLKVGVGFGKGFLEKIEAKLSGKGITEYTDGRPSRSLEYLVFSSEEKTKEDKGGDIFIHAKGNSVGTLFEFQHLFMNTLPYQSIDEDKTHITRGFTYQHHRDISGYMIGTTNPITTEERRIAAVTITGGSFAITQKWKHKMNVIEVERPTSDVEVDQQDKWIGCKRETGKMLEDNEMNAQRHVQLMRNVKQKIVRQSLPYTEEKDMHNAAESKSRSGLFFLAYAKNTTAFNEMLQKMKGCDTILNMSSVEDGAYWYFPGMTELDNLNRDGNDGTKYKGITSGTIALSYKPSQQTVYEPDEDAEYALFYWIHLNELSNITRKEIVASCSQIHHTAQRVNDPTGLKVGVGFGKQFLERTKQSFPNEIRSTFELDKLEYKERNIEVVTDSGKCCNLPSTGGDIFVHAKGRSFGTLYEFQHLFFNTLPPNSVDAAKTTVTRGFTFKHHRDISGYMIAGSKSPRTTDERRNVAVVKDTGGSYAMTQKWKHNMTVVRVERPSNKIVNEQNQWIGCSRETGKAHGNTPMSHLALMRKEQVGNQLVVRQSLPYTEENGPTGLFFLAYAKDTSPFNKMLERMTSDNGDELFRMSENLSGAYWYFPGMEELDKLYKTSQEQK